jgi:hypothetical protein
MLHRYSDWAGVDSLALYGVVNAYEILSHTAHVAKARSQDPSKRAMAHLNFWKNKEVYVRIASGWQINPVGVHFEPREYA